MPYTTTSWTNSYTGWFAYPTTQTTTTTQTTATTSVRGNRANITYIDELSQLSQQLPTSQILAEYLEDFIKREKRRMKKLSVSKKDNEAIRDILENA